MEIKNTITNVLVDQIPFVGMMRRAYKWSNPEIIYWDAGCTIMLPLGMMALTSIISTYPKNVQETVGLVVVIGMNTLFGLLNTYDTNGS